MKPGDKYIRFRDLNDAEYVLPLSSIMAVRSDGSADYGHYTHLIMLDGTWVSTSYPLDEVLNLMQEVSG